MRDLALNWHREKFMRIVVILHAPVNYYYCHFSVRKHVFARTSAINDIWELTSTAKILFQNASSSLIFAAPFHLKIFY